MVMGGGQLQAGKSLEERRKAGRQKEGKGGRKIGKEERSIGIR